MKRVLLTSGNLRDVPYPVPPLGLCMLARALQDRYEVHLYDPLLDAGASLPALVQELAPSYVGLGLRNVDNAIMAEPMYFVDEVRERLVAPLRAHGAAPLILGGSGYSLFPRELLAVLGADYGVVGEGEAALPALLAALDSGSDPACVPGVVVRGREAEHAPPDAPLDFAALPAAAIDAHVSFDPYRQRGAYSIQTKRGCARRCLYCAYPVIEGRRYRKRSAASVADEIEGVLQRLGDVTIEIVDSVFNEPPGHAEHICREIARRGLRPRLRTMGINPAGASGELFALMKRAGFAQIDVTPDSASPAMLEALGKGFTLAELVAVARELHEHELPAMWFFLLGGPGETERTLAETFAFIDEHVAAEDMARLGEGLRILPGTGLHELVVAHGLVGPSDSLLAPRFYVSPALGAERLAAWVREACQSRPNCIRDVEATPSPEALALALRLRRERGVDEPMFRTLLRLRREGRA